MGKMKFSIGSINVVPILSPIQCPAMNAPERVGAAGRCPGACSDGILSVI